MTWLHDLRDAFRSLRRDRWFTIGAALLLGLGIGACTLVYSLFDAVLLKPLAVADPESIVRLVRALPVLGVRGGFQLSQYEALRDHSHSLAAVAAAFDRNASYSDGRLPSRVRVQLVSDSFFDVFAAPTHLGRTTQGAERESAGTLPATLSFLYWRNHYAGDPNIIGRKVFIQGHPYVIVGVAGRGFNGAAFEHSPDVWLPLEALPLLVPDPQDRKRVELEVYARLRPGVPLDPARDETVALLRAGLQDETGPATEAERNADALMWSGLRLDPIPRGVSRIRDQVSPAVTLLLAAVGVLLLMVAANVSGLLLARQSARGREVAIRLAVGASPARILRLSVAAALILAAAGSAIGVVVTAMAAPALPSLLPPVRMLDTTTLPMAASIGVNWRILAFAAAVCLLVTLIVALAPAMYALRTDIESVLRTGRQPSNTRLRPLLVAVQVCLSTALLVSAIDLGQSLHRLRTMDAGLDAPRIVTFVMDSYLSVSPAARTNAAIVRAKDEAKQLPGVRAAALASRPLLRGSGMKMTAAPAGQIATAADFMNVSTNAVTPDYFETMGLRFVAGRNYTAGEAAAAPDSKPATLPAVVNQAFVDRFFPGTDGIGAKFGFGMGAPVQAQREIIGVVTNAKYRSLREPWQPIVYGLYTAGESGQPAMLHVRTEADPAAVIEPVRGLLSRLAPDLPVYEITTLGQDVEASLATEKLLSRVAAALGAAAAVVVAAGLFALLSFVVAQRTREIGIRLALGARARDIVRLVCLRILAVSAAGIACGAALSQAANRLFAAVLYGVSPSDPRPFIAAGLLILVAALLSAAIPAARALRIDPASALRES